MSIFTIIIGGPASGKNWVYENFCQQTSLVDMDNELTKLIKDKPRAMYVNSAIRAVTQRLKKSFKSGIDVTQITVGGTYTTLANKLKWAKEYEYITKIIFVDVSIEQALQQQEFRKKQGGHIVPTKKIKNQNENVRNIYEKIKNHKLLDYAIRIEPNA